jgi:hypothetical protein
MRNNFQCWSAGHCRWFFENLPFYPPATTTQQHHSTVCNTVLDGKYVEKKILNFIITRQYAMVCNK